jgi:hypothetical protein
MGDRLRLQEFILEKFMDRVKAAPRPAISDRTPLDMIGYMLAEVTMHNTPIEFHDQIQRYVDKCLAETVLHFDMILMLRPLPIFEVDPTKPPPNRAYQSAVQFLIEGAGQQSDHLCSGVIVTTDLQRRVDATCCALEARQCAMVEAMRGIKIH